MNECEENHLGFITDVTIIGSTGKEKTVKARVDTGAASCSISVKLAAELELGPVSKVKEIKSANGRKVRPFVKSKFRIKGKTITVYASLSDRKHMTYPVLIGRNALKKLGFLINPNKTQEKKEN